MASDADWDIFGRLVMAVGLVALLAYLAPGILPLSPVQRRYFEVATLALIGVALLLASGAALVWFLR